MKEGTLLGEELLDVAETTQEEHDELYDGEDVPSDAESVFVVGSDGEASEEEADPPAGSVGTEVEWPAAEGGGEWRLFPREKEGQTPPELKKEAFTGTEEQGRPDPRDVDLDADSDPIDFFYLFMGREEIDAWAARSNAYYYSVLEPKGVLPGFQPVQKWEMYAFMAVFIIGSLRSLPSIYYMWKHPEAWYPWGDTRVRDLFKAGLAGFKQLRAVFHVSAKPTPETDEEKEDKYFKVRAVLEHLRAVRLCSPWVTCVMIDAGHRPTTHPY
jgi:hypothetical protein